MKVMRLFVVLVLLFAWNCTLAEEVFYDMKDAPEWVKGILVLNTRGTTDIAEEQIFRQYICFFDFDAEQVDALEVPSDGMFFQDSGTSKDTVIVNRMSSQYGYGLDWGLKWKKFSGVPILLQTDEDGKHYKYEIDQESGINCYNYFYLDAPLAVLGFNNDTNTVYYLGYSVSTEGKLEVLLQSRTYDRVETYYRFPADYEFSWLECAISNDGKIAWTERDAIKVSDGMQVYTCPDIRNCGGAISWLNEDEIIYAFDENSDNVGFVRETYLGVWNVVTNEIRPLFKEKQAGFVFAPYQIAVNAENQLIAYYYEEIEGVRFRIGIMSLENGDICSYVPWNQSIYEEYKQDAAIAGTVGIANGGTMYFMPDDKVVNITPSLFWYHDHQAEKD